jgi:hypothetical protein
MHLLREAGAALAHAQVQAHEGTLAERQRAVFAFEHEAGGFLASQSQSHGGFRSGRRRLTIEPVLLEAFAQAHPGTV